MLFYYTIKKGGIMENSSDSEGSHNLYQNLKTSLTNYFKKINFSTYSQNLQFTLDDFVKIHQIPDCISKNPEFKQIGDVFNIADANDWCKFESQTGEDTDYLVNFGVGHLKSKSKSIFGFHANMIVGANYEYKIKSKINYGDVEDEIQTVEFKFKIFDENILKKLVTYSKCIKFDILSKPENYKSSNKNEFDIDKIIKVTEKTYAQNHFVMFFDEYGKRLQPLENVWWAIELVGSSKPKSVTVVENMIDDWQDFNQNALPNSSAKDKGLEQ